MRSKKQVKHSNNNRYLGLTMLCGNVVATTVDMSFELTLISFVVFTKCVRINVITGNFMFSIINLINVVPPTYLKLAITFRRLPSTGIHYEVSRDNIPALRPLTHLLILYARTQHRLRGHVTTSPFCSLHCWSVWHWIKSQ